MLQESLVDKGVHKLTEHFGNLSWVHDINTDRLEMHTSLGCILGQLFSEYYEGLGKIGIEPGQESYEAGFTPWGGPGVYIDSDELTEAWKSRLKNYQSYIPKQEDSTVEESETELDVRITVDISVTLTDAQVGRLFRLGRERGHYKEVEDMLEQILSEKAIMELGNDLDI